VNKLFVFGITALLVVTTAACGFDDEEMYDDGGACTTEVVPSVEIAIINASGSPLPGATVTYSVEGQNELEAECIDPMDALSGECTVFTAGWEITGDFIIVAEKQGFQVKPTILYSFQYLNSFHPYGLNHSHASLALRSDAEFLSVAGRLS
jgi:hypothetical protein